MQAIALPSQFLTQGHQHFVVAAVKHYGNGIVNYVLLTKLTSQMKSKFMSFGVVVGRTSLLSLLIWQSTMVFNSLSGIRSSSSFAQTFAQTMDSDRSTEKLLKRGLEKSSKRDFKGAIADPWEWSHPKPLLSLASVPSLIETTILGLTSEVGQNSLVSRTTGIDYGELDRALRNRQWKEADKLTFTLMLKATKNPLDEQDYFMHPDRIRRLPSEDLKLIDRLWVQHSKGKLGFSVQKRIWKECGSPSPSYESHRAAWKEFGRRVNWRGGTAADEWRFDSEMNFSEPQKNPGHLPRWGGLGGWGGWVKVPSSDWQGGRCATAQLRGRHCYAGGGEVGGAHLFSRSEI